MKKYELTDEAIKIEGRILYRIKALVDFADVKAGDLGGFVLGVAVIGDDVDVDELLGVILGMDGIDEVGDDFLFVSGGEDEGITLVHRLGIELPALISGRANVYGAARVSGFARVLSKAVVTRMAHVSGNACIFDYALVGNNAKVFDNAKIYEFAQVRGNACVCGDAKVYGFAQLNGDAKLSGFAEMSDYDTHY